MVSQVIQDEFKNVHNSFFKLVQHNDVKGIRALFHKIRQDSDKFAPFFGNCKNIANCLTLQKSGDTSLHICARLGPSYLELFRYLVEDEGANVEQLNKEEKAVLHDAAQFSNFAVVQFLLQKGANVNVVKRADWTPLMLACTKQDVKVVEILLSYGADLNFVNKDGWNVLHLAAREGNVQIVNMLLKSDSNKNSGRNKLAQVKSKNGRIPLHTSVMHGHLEVTRLLIEDSSLPPEEQVLIVDSCGTTPIMECCRFGHVELLKYLVRLGQEDGNFLQVCNSQGQNCLAIAAEAGQTNVVRSLIGTYGMDVDQPSKGGEKMTALHWSAKEGHVETVIVLLNELNASSDLKDGKGRTAFDLARSFKHSEVSKLFKVA